MKVVILKLCLLLIAILFALYISATYYFQRTLAYLKPLPYPNGSEYDFIVVGSGTAGSAVTGRLVEAGYDVLLIEAGGPSNWLMGLPAMVLYFQLSLYDWQYKSEPQHDACLALNNQQSNWPRGKVLGGSSMLNYMLYMRGHKKDYDEWAELGNSGWSYEEVLPFFKKGEKYQKSSIVGDERYHRRSMSDHEKLHGYDGPVGVQMRPPSAKINEVFINGTIELGHKVGDLNGDVQDNGFSFNDVWLTDNWRMGSFRSYCEKYHNNGKLDVLTFAHGTKIILQGKKAKGIRVERFGGTLEYFVKKELIISAGAIGSPQLLMLSGIGPKSHLRNLDIPVLQDLPVGDNLQDHLFSWVSITYDAPIGTYIWDIYNPLSWLQMMIKNSGPLFDSGVGVLGLLSTPNNQEKPRPDLQFHFASHNYAIDFGLGIKEVANINDATYETFKPYEDMYGGYIIPSLNRPKSRGTIRLRSKNPFDHPIIDPKYLSNKYDVDVFVAGMKFVDDLIATKAFKKYSIVKIPDTVNCPNMEITSREYNECFIHAHTLTIYHHCGTNKMGPKSDKTSVVDPDLKVKGIQGLRVIDASIMPLIPGGNINAATLMIAEKGADMIIKEYGRVAGVDVKAKTDKKNEL